MLKQFAPLTIWVSEWKNKWLNLPQQGYYNTAYLYKRIGQYIRPYWFRAIIAVVITIPIGALDGGIALALKPYVDTMQTKAPTFEVSLIPGLIIGFTLIQGVLNYTSIYLNGWLGFRIMSDLRLDLFNQLQKMDIVDFDKTNTGDVIQKYYRAPESLQANVLNNVKQILTRLFSSLGLMSVLLYTSRRLALIAITISLLIFFPSVLIRKRLKTLFKNSTNVAGDIISFYSETVAGIKTIYAYDLMVSRLTQFNRSQRDYIRTAMNTVQAQGLLTPTMHMIASVGIAIVLWQGSLMVLHKEITTGSFVSFVTAMLMLYNPIKNLGASILNAQLSMNAAALIFKLIDKEPVIKDEPDAQDFNMLKIGITIRGVSFKYRPFTVAPLALQNVSLQFKKGQTTALVGSSGGGKSTIASLIPRFYEVYQGDILFDDTSIKKIKIKSLRQMIAIVTQDTFLFRGTVRENLLVGKADATESELNEALKRACLLEFVQQLPEGLDTEIGERGVMMSGGQRQRLAIARALLKNAQIVILDEATSALDNQSEAFVQKAMEELMQDRTVIVIAHRLSTIQNANLIAVLEKGQVLETGTHEELVLKNGAYTQLYQAQFKQGLFQQDPLPLDAVLLESPS